jgi:hypothetical protein
MKKLPTQVKIGGHTFILTITELEDASGETSFNDCTIKLNTSSSQTVKESTLLHEIFIHTLNTTFTDDENIHATLDSMVEQLYQVLVDNHFCFDKEHEEA